MASVRFVRPEPRLGVASWTADVAKDQVLTVGYSETFTQEVAEYLVAHGAAEFCDDPEVTETVQEPAPVEEPEAIEEPAPEEAL